MIASASRSRASPAGSPYCRAVRGDLPARGGLAHRRGEHRRVEPLGGQGAEARHRLAARRLEHAADQRGGAVRHRLPRRAVAAPACLGRGRAACVAASRDEEAALRPRLDQAAGEQLVVGADDRRRAHRVAAGALAHRGQPRARARAGAGAMRSA